MRGPTDATQVDSTNGTAMPGYRALSSSVTGSAADSAREAESLRRDGNPQTAVLLLEEALAASEVVSPELPGWLCGRLAALYRTLGRYDDEVRLLERYRESQVSEEARSRYDARLSKAYTIAERKRRSESGALSSVRKVLGTPRRRITPAAGSVTVAPPQEQVGGFIHDMAEQLGAASDGEAEGMSAVIARHSAEARAHGIPVERLVAALRTAAANAPTTHTTQAERERRFSSALVSLLAAWFEER